MFPVSPLGVMVMKKSSSSSLTPRRVMSSVGPVPLVLTAWNYIHSLLYLRLPSRSSHDFLVVVVVDASCWGFGVVQFVLHE